MPNRTLILALAAMLAIGVGFALSFFELIILGGIMAIVAVSLGLRRRPTHDSPHR
jgi:hypothetical protein